MNARDYAVRFAQDLDDLEWVKSRVERTVATFHDWRGRGFPAETSVTRVGRGGVPDPTAIASQLGDRAERLVAELFAQLDQVHAIASSLRAKAALVADPPIEGLGLPGCRSCARIFDHNHGACGDRPDHEAKRLWSPVVNKAKGLCRWCWDFERRWGEIPAVEVLEAHRDGRKITTKLIRDVMPNADPDVEAARRMVG